MNIEPVCILKRSEKASVQFPRKQSYDFGDEDDVVGMSNKDVLGIAFYSFLGFTIVQTTYALRAKSSAMIADSSAMFVDAGTYLCNMLAERLKSRTLSDEEKELPSHSLELRMKLQNLYLELFPPLVSVFTLMYVTFTTFKGAAEFLIHRDQEEISETDQPNLKVMMVFSSINLLLDMVNVSCFARTQQAVMTPINFETRNEKTPLLSSVDETLASSMGTTFTDDELSGIDPINLNMFSAWTVSSRDKYCKCSDQCIGIKLMILLISITSYQHVFADTMRSVAVLLAGSLSYYTHLISPTMADSSAAIIVSLVIFLSCLPLIKGLVDTIREITVLRRRQTNTDELLEETIEICV